MTKCDPCKTGIRMVMAEVQVILGEDENKKVMTRVGSNLARRWLKEHEDEQYESPEQLLNVIADYIEKEMELAKASVEMKGDSGAVLHIDDCAPCCGNYVKELGGTPACPISSFAVNIMKRKFKEYKKVSLDGISKTPDEKGVPKIGICHQALTFEK